MNEMIMRDGNDKGRRSSLMHGNAIHKTSLEELSICKYYSREKGKINCISNSFVHVKDRNERRDRKNLICSPCEEIRDNLNLMRSVSLIQEKEMSYVNLYIFCIILIKFIYGRWEAQIILRCRGYCEISLVCVSHFIHILIIACKNLKEKVLFFP